jgi:hypothetical protein
MEKLPRKIGSTAVNAIAGDRMSEVFEVNAYLVGAACFGAAFEEAQLPVAGHQFPGGLGGTRAWAA